MTEFLILMLLLLLFALAFLFWPLFRFRHEKVAKKNLGFTLSLCSVFIVTVACTTYYFLGSAQALQVALWQKKHAVQIETEMKTYRQDPKALIAALKNRLAEDPHSARGWYLLGRVYLATNDMPGAETAFSKAHELDKKNIETSLQYLQVLYLNQGNQLSDKAIALLQSILVVQPGNPLALNWQAILFYQQKQYQKAVNIWEQLLVHFDPNSDDAKALMQVIATTQKKIAAKDKNG